MGKERLLVNSIHHQAIDRLGEGLRGVAKSSDGLVEAFEMPSYQKFLGLQFHPERLHQKEDYAKIFKSFLGGFND